MSILKIIFDSSSESLSNGLVGSFLECSCDLMIGSWINVDDILLFNGWFSNDFEVEPVSDKIGSSEVSSKVD